MKKWATLSTIVLLATLARSASAKEVVALARDCRVFQEPAYRSETTCRFKQGAKVLLVKQFEGFVRIRGKNCEGFISDSCFQGSRAVSSLLEGRPSDAGIKVGLDTRLSLLSGRVAYSSDPSSGLGWGVGALGRLPLSRDFHVSAALQLQKLRLSRDLDGSGSIRDNPTSYDQSILFTSLRATSGYRLPVGMGRTVQLWIDGGLEYLFPISASQYDSASGTDVSFTSTDRPFFLLLGPSVFIPWGPFRFVGNLEFFYNLAAATSSRLIGARMGLAMLLTL